LQNPHILGAKLQNPHIGAKLQNPHICKIAKPAHWEKNHIIWLILGHIHIRHSNGRHRIGQLA
jgi:hypothetical protein